MNINLILTNFAQQELVIARDDIERERIKVSIDRLKKNLKNNLTNNCHAWLAWQ
jgi:hypothetical protein